MLSSRFRRSTSRSRWGDIRPSSMSQPAFANQSSPTRTRLKQAYENPLPRTISSRKSVTWQEDDLVYIIQDGMLPSCRRIDTAIVINLSAGISKSCIFPIHILQALPIFDLVSIEKRRHKHTRHFNMRSILRALSESTFHSFAPSQWQFSRVFTTP